jgi:endonuclease YncB( thermonuclease family)
MPDAAAALLCVVVGITDGDTLTARCEVPEGKVNITVRLAEIDAPEKGQAWGARSKQHLSGVCFRKPTEVRPRTTDRYVADRSPYTVQANARETKRGLWSDAAPEPPWEWRATKGQQSR